MIHKASNEFSGLKVALAHDYLLYSGGAERVIKTIAALFPRAPLYTLLARQEMAADFPKNKIIPSYLNNISRFVPHRFLLPFYPVATESIDLRNFDLVISSTSSFMKGIVVKPKTCHVCYCHTPTRYLWDMNEDYLETYRDSRGVKSRNGDSGWGCGNNRRGKFSA